jgi:hypothetical protein
VLNFTYKRAEKMFKYYLMVSVTVSLFLAVCLWLKDAYSFTSLWCWVREYMYTRQGPMQESVHSWFPRPDPSIKKKKIQTTTHAHTYTHRRRTTTSSSRGSTRSWP